MVFGQVLERFIEESPVSVMVRGLMEKFLSPQKLDQLFERNSGIASHKGFFIIREDKCLPWHGAGKFRDIGSVEGGKVFEQTMSKTHSSC
ncbi:MAG: hypothetical protein GVY04_06135 [Cyanobacteria bacterium]|jgi:hypothetical protein|nr:hypothetical protein [Cyanobacteria bacterium GSL.Bin1]